MSMKFIKEMTGKGIQIPAAALKLCGFEGGKQVELHAEPETLVALKANMTAMELIRAAQQLQELSASLTTHLAKVCGPCDGCSGNVCPFQGLLDNPITLPEDLREEAGIPREAKLCTYVDEEENAVIITAAEYDHDLTDVPAMILEMFSAANVCIGELDDLITDGDIVYGG